MRNLQRWRSVPTHYVIQRVGQPLRHKHAAMAGSGEWGWGGWHWGWVWDQSWGQGWDEGWGQGWSQGSGQSWHRRTPRTYNQHNVPQPALPNECVLTAWIPYLGKDFGGDTWFNLQRQAAQEGVLLKCRLSAPPMQSSWLCFFVDHSVRSLVSSRLHVALL